MRLTPAAIALALLVGQVPAPAHCSLHLAGARWEGSCGRLFDQAPEFALAAAASVTTGTWSQERHPVAVWAGDMTDAGHPNAPVEVELYAGNSGIVRTDYGWYPVSDFVQTPSGLQFEIDTSREVPPNALDRQIVLRAEAILASASLWNRADNRTCLPAARTLSIYCAMEQATVDVTGGFHHRRPALEVVRRLVNERSVGRHYHHRLMDYNNDPRTRFADVRRLFAEALTRIGQ